MGFLLVPLLIAAPSSPTGGIMRGQDPDAPPIGPQGRWWWVKLLIAMAVAIAVLALVIWGYLTFLQD